MDNYTDEIDAALEASVTAELTVVRALGGDPVGLIMAALGNIGERDRLIAEIKENY